MEDKIKQRIVKLFNPALKTIEKQSNCEHNWQKNGAAYYRCSNCGYLADDRELDKLIIKLKLIKKGVTPDIIKKWENY